MQALEMIEVESSNIAAVAHSIDDLIVKFNSGTTYVYHGVAREVFEELLSAESKGKFLNTVVRPNYPFEKVESL